MWSPGDLPCVEDVYIAPRNQSYNEAERSINPVLHLLWFFVIRTLRCALKFSTFRCRLHPVQQMSPLSQFSCTTGEGITIIDARFPILPWIDLLSAIDSNRKRSVACLESWITLLLWLVKNYISLYRVYYCVANTVFRECYKYDLLVGLFVLLLSIWYAIIICILWYLLPRLL